MELFDFLDWDCNKSSFEAMGEALAHIVGREKPYTYRYIRSVLYKNYKPGKMLERAIKIAGAEFDGVPLTISEASEATVFIPPGIDVDGAYLVTDARICVSERCFNKFIPNIWNRKYCYVCRPVK